MANLKPPDWLSWPVAISIAIILGGGVTSGGRALWVFAANEKIQGLTIPAAGVGIAALGLYTYFLVARPSVLAGLGAAVLALAFGLLSFYYCGFQSLLGRPMQGFADFVMALLPETCMVLGGVVLGLALKASREEREARERKAAQAAQAEQDNGWRSLEQENERKRLANERYAAQNERLRLKAAMASLTVSETHTRQIKGSGASPLIEAAVSGKYRCICGWSTDRQRQFAGHRGKCPLAIAERAGAIDKNA